MPRLMQRNRYNTGPQRNLALREERNKGKEKAERSIRRPDVVQYQTPRMAINNPVQVTRSMAIEVFPTEQSPFSGEFERELDFLRERYNL
jgi:hypothetical protein